METCKYGSGAGKRKPTAVKRKGVVCRAYIWSIQRSEKRRIKFLLNENTSPKIICTIQLNSTDYL